jgi:hypothetical protein
MSIKRLGWVLPMLLLLCISAKADGIASVYFNGGYAFGDNGYGIPPYQGTVNGQDAELYCVDFTHDITANTSWQASVTDISNTSDYSSTRLGSGTIYSEITWLLDQSQGTTNQTTQAELQWAVWSFSGGGNPYGTNSNLITLASNAVAAGFTDNSWEILTPTGNYGQEFVVKTPEPSSLLLLSMGLVGLAIVGGRKRIA